MIPLRDINPTRRVPVMTIAVIGINVLAFLGQQMFGEEIIFRFGMRPALLLGDFDQYGYTLVTSMFLHGDLLHIGSNMLYLWIFGNNVEDRLGILRFVLFYFVTGFLASGAQIAIDPGSTIPNIGASGAIAGVLGAYLALFPNARVQTLVLFWYFVRVIEVSAVWLLGWWLFLQVLSGLGSLGFAAQGGVAYFAHIGGFVAGWLLIRVFAVGRPDHRRLGDASLSDVDDIFRPRRRRDDRWWDL